MTSLLKNNIAHATNKRVLQSYQMSEMVLAESCRFEPGNDFVYFIRDGRIGRLQNHQLQDGCDHSNENIYIYCFVRSRFYTGGVITLRVKFLFNLLPLLLHLLVLQREEGRGGLRGDRCCWWWRGSQASCASVLIICLKVS